MTMAFGRQLSLLYLFLFLATITVTTTEGVIFPPCNVCRSPNVVRKKDAAIAIARLFTLGVVRTCGDLDLLGQTGWISDRTCIRLQTRRWVRITCDCGQETGQPVIAPTKKPRKPTSSPTITAQPSNTRQPSITRQPTITAQPSVTRQPTSLTKNPTRKPIKPIKTKAPKKAKKRTLL